MRTLRIFFSRWQNWLGLLLVLSFIGMAIAAPLLSPVDSRNPGPMKTVGRSSDSLPHPPSPEAPLGTLPHQLSVYHGLVWGARSALFFGLTITLICAVIGVLIGAVSGYFGGFLNTFLMRITDAFLAFPVIAGVVLIQQLITIAINNMGIQYSLTGIYVYVVNGLPYEVPASIKAAFDFLLKIDSVAIALILFSWMPYARVMNTTVLRLKDVEYVQAAKTSGDRPFRIIFRHLIPNAIAPMIVLAARDIGSIVVLQATFVFIGFGHGSPWATLLVNGRDWIYAPGGIFTYWWVFLPATLAIVLFGIGWNLLGDGLNDALNPHSV